MVVDKTRLRRAGFLGVDRAQRLLNSDVLAHTDAEWLIDQAGVSADPDQALLGYVRLAEAAIQAGEQARRALSSICSTPTAAARLFAILGMSVTLSEYLITHPDRIHILADARIARAGLDLSLIHI